MSDQGNGKVEEIVAFFDTNICLHYPLPKDIDWQAWLGAKRVRLVACLGLIDELDSKKDHATLGKRAANWIKEIEQSDEKGEIREGVSLVIYVTPQAVHSKDDSKGDAAIVEQAKKYIEEHPDELVAFVTEDAGMRVRCRTMGIRAIGPNKAVRHPDPSGEDKKKIAELEKRIREMANKLPDLRLRLTYDGTEVPDGEPLQINLVRLKAGDFERRFEVLKSRLRQMTHRPYHEHEQFIEHVERWRRWLLHHEQILDESSRTFVVKPTVYNIGNAPAEEVTIEFRSPKFFFSASGYQKCLEGQRLIPQEFPHWTGTGRVEVDRSAYLPLNSLWPERREGAYLGSFENGALKYQWYQIAHAQSLPIDRIWFTFPTWEQVRPFQFSVRLYGMKPPFDEQYQMKVIPTIVEGPEFPDPDKP